ncbi:hypothetical protein [Campylobacter taeniopygiae]|uniref:hypothetical protein n=1 Tax=Campylobacter taeniopygiae TaxID=2510188 RepID=UPI003D6C3366
MDNLEQKIAKLEQRISLLEDCFLHFGNKAFEEINNLRYLRDDQKQILSLAIDLICETTKKEFDSNHVLLDLNSTKVKADNS